MANEQSNQALFVIDPTVQTAVVSDPKTGVMGVTL